MCLSYLEEKKEYMRIYMPNLWRNKRLTRRLKRKSLDAVVMNQKGENILDFVMIDV